MKNLIFLLCLVSVIAFGQKTDGELNTQNNNTIFTATLTPTRVGNMFEQSILSKVNKRTPEFMDSLDITKIIRFYLSGSHPTATTYNLTLPNGSGTIARTSDLSGWLTGTLTGDVTIEPDVDETRVINLGTTSKNIVEANIWGSFNVFGKDTGGFTSVILGANPYRIYNFSVSSISDISFNANNASQLYLQETGSWFLGGGGRTIGYNGIGFQFNLDTNATGDTYHRDSSGYLERLPIGTEGTILRAGASVPAYSTFTIPDTISALSTFVSNSANVLTEITPSAGQSIRVNAGGTAWEAYTPGGGSSVLSDITAATAGNTINSGANHQIWDWNSLTSGTGMSFRSSSTGADSSTLKVVSIEKSGANSNSSQTTTALNVSNTSTGTSATNVAGRFTASGGDNNYALDIVGGVNWSNGAERSTWTQTHTGSQPGINLETNRNAAAVQFGIQNTNSGTSAETRFRLAGSGQTGWLSMAGGNNTASYGEGYRMALWNSANAGIIFGTNNTGRAVFTNDNKFVFGATSITSGSVLADFQSTTSGVLLPRVTNTAAISTPVNGMVAYDSDTNEFIFRQNDSWTGLGIGGSTGSTDNALTGADGTGGSTIKQRPASIDDSGNLALGLAATSGTSRTISAQGSESAINTIVESKGNGRVIIGVGNDTEPNIIQLGKTSGSPDETYIVPGNWNQPVNIMPDSSTTIVYANGNWNFRNNIISSDSTLSVDFQSGKSVPIDGTLNSITVSGTSATINNTYIGRNAKCTNNSETDLTIPSTLQFEGVFTVTQWGNGTVNLLAGSNVNITGKTSTTFKGDMIWVYLIEKSGGTSYYIGR